MPAPSSRRRNGVGSTSLVVRVLLTTPRRIQLPAPSAARICSFAQPAQHRYFQGSSTEMARLSRERSCPAAAQDGHCVTQFRPTRRWTSTYLRIWKCCPSKGRGATRAGFPSASCGTSATHLRLQIVCGAVEPVPLSGGPVHAERSTDRITKLSCLHDVLLREGLNALGLAASFEFPGELSSQMPDVDAGLLCADRALKQNPEMSAAPALLQTGLDTALAQFELKLQKILQRAGVVGVYRHPFGALCLRIYGVKGPE